MRRDRLAWAMTLVLWGAFACGGASKNSASDDDDEAGEDGGDASSSKKRKKMERPVSEDGKRWGGWRWKGKREDCFFVHDNQCFATLEEACKAAKCKMADCVQDDGAPAKVSCEK